MVNPQLLICYIFSFKQCKHIHNEIIYEMSDNHYEYKMEANNY